MESATKIKLQKEIDRNSQELLIMTSEEFAEVKRKVASALSLDNAKTVGSYVAPVMDSHTVYGQIREFGLGGKVVEKTVDGRRYVILKGYPGLRKVLKGTRYIANNPKIISFAVGKLGVNNSIRQGAKLSVLLTAPINVLKFLLNEQFTLSALIGTIATDLVKLGVSSMLAAAAAATAGAITTVAAGPLVAAIFVGVLTAILLEKVGKEFGLNDALIATIDQTCNTLYDRTVGTLARKMVEVEGVLNWQARNKLPVGKGIFY